MSKTFSRVFKLKENKKQEGNAIIDSEVSSFYKEVNLHELLKPTKQKADLAERPLLAQYLSHCCRLRTSFVSIKKCGSSECTVCLLPRLLNEIFECIHHLPNPTPDKSNEGHCSKFGEVFGTKTSESHIPFIKVKQTKKSNLEYTVLKQHATNTKMTLRCSECTTRQVFFKKKLATKILFEFQKHTADILFTCGTTVLKLVGNNKDMIEHLQITENLNCQMPVEKPFYSAGYEPCCCHCATKSNLVNNSSLLSNLHPL